MWIAIYLLIGIGFCLLPYTQGKINKEFNDEMSKNYLAKSLTSQGVENAYLIFLCLVVVFHPVIIISWVIKALKK